MNDEQGKRSQTFYLTDNPVNANIHPRTSYGGTVDHYTDADKKRLGPIAQRVREEMLGAGWVDLDSLANRTGIRVGTIGSKLREITDRDHAFLGLEYERRRAGNGIHEYRLFTRQPEQLALIT
jgi:hypothetical protein